MRQAVNTAALPSFAHVQTLLSPHGVVQFAHGAEPEPTSGTCLDDNARALLVATLALRADPDHAGARTLGDVTIDFVRGAQRSDGQFHNLADASGAFLDDIGSSDAFGRAVWACGVVSRCAPDAQWRSAAATVLTNALPALETLAPLQPTAYAILGLAAAVAPDVAAPLASAADPFSAGVRDAMQRHLQTLCGDFDARFRASATDDWAWWVPTLTWGNARLPEALLLGGAATGKLQYVKDGLRALEFLAGITQAGPHFIPIGNEGWYDRHAVRAMYDQQPIEACAMIDAWLAAQRSTGDAQYRTKAAAAFQWFHGGNTENLAVADTRLGGCHDGLKRGLVNPNMGAESTLSYLHAHLRLAFELAPSSAFAGR